MEKKYGVATSLVSFIFPEVLLDTLEVVTRFGADTLLDEATWLDGQLPPPASDFDSDSDSARVRHSDFLLF